jgi:Ca-activated chloride channel family protein
MRHPIPVAALFLTVACVPGESIQATLPLAEPAELPYRISVNLDLVVLQATVRDRKGGFASDLTVQDFQVFEDGVRQNLRIFRHEDSPVTVGLVVDHSGSMRHRLTEVMAAAELFVESSNPKDQMFVVNFNDNVRLGLPEGTPFSNRGDELEAAIGQTPAEGQTALYDAVSVALDRLKSGSHEKKVLIVISDGGDNASSLNLVGVLKKAGESNAVLYTIGIFSPDDADQNPGVLTRMARETGGEAFFPAELSQVGPICQRIALDIRQQYTLGYVSANTKKMGGHRAIRVTAQAAGRDLVVRTRTGYIANGGGR